MTVGPLTKLEAARWCQCSPSELCPGPLAGIDEGDKVRAQSTIAPPGGANAQIQQNTKERTTAPTVLDCVHAIHWLRAAQKLDAPDRPPSVPGASDLASGDSLAWQWPAPDCQ